eukprot:Rhum_TRINITY_DN10498_c0_g2::Rhum_TRINITY_DN10498_c0_g2_i1::g.38683::m.38683
MYHGGDGGTMYPGGALESVRQIVDSSIKQCVDKVIGIENAVQSKCIMDGLEADGAGVQGSPEWFRRLDPSYDYRSHADRKQAFAPSFDVDMSFVPPAPTQKRKKEQAACPRKTSLRLRSGELPPLEHMLKHEHAREPARVPLHRRSYVVDRPWNSSTGVEPFSHHRNVECAPTSPVYGVRPKSEFFYDGGYNHAGYTGEHSAYLLAHGEQARDPSLPSPSRAAFVQDLLHTKHGISRASEVHHANQPSQQLPPPPIPQYDPVKAEAADAKQRAAIMPPRKARSLPLSCSTTRVPASASSLRSPNEVISTHFRAFAPRGSQREAKPAQSAQGLWARPHQTHR